MLTVVVAVVVGGGIGLGVLEPTDDFGQTVEEATASLDTDFDGLSTERERELGTDPTLADTDGDRLPDGWEVNQKTDDGAALAGADPLHKDLYVQVSYGKDIPQLTGRERAGLTRVWDDMAVQNPDGTDGISIHLVERRVETTVVMRSRADMDRFQNEYYTEQQMGARKCVYHHALGGVVTEGDVAGRGDSPGYFVMFDGRTGLNYVEGTVSDRVRTITHELLHNIVGGPDGMINGHTNGGWLYHSGDNPAYNEYLSEKPRTVLSEQGFASSEYYEQTIC